MDATLQYATQRIIELEALQLVGTLEAAWPVEVGMV